MAGGDRTRSSLTEPAGRALTEWLAIRDRVDAAGIDDPFAAQLDLGIRINQVIHDWLVEQLDRA